jgi:hypothetical protein
VVSGAPVVTEGAFVVGVSVVVGSSVTSPSPLQAVRTGTMSMSIASISANARLVGNEILVISFLLGLFLIALYANELYTEKQYG